MTISSPVIILVRPQMGENIGATARACMNFGLSELRIVAPRDGWPNEKAYSMAAHATGILDNAKIFDSVADAAHDIHHLYATSARSREIVKPVMSVEEGMRGIASLRGAVGDEAIQLNNKTGLLRGDAARNDELPSTRAAIMFGPERTGLTNDDLTLADAILTIPTDEENASLNLAQSVVIVGYEWFKRSLSSRPDITGLSLASTSKDASPMNPDNISPPATKSEISFLLDHLEKSLEAGNFFKSPDARDKMWVNLRNIFTRNDLTSQEVRTLHGVIRALAEGK